MTAHGALIGGCSTNWTNQRQEITRILLAASLGSAWTKQAGRAEILLARLGRANQAVVFASKTNFFERVQPDVLHCSAVVCSSSRLFWVSPRLREARSYKWGQTDPTKGGGPPTGGLVGRIRLRLIRGLARRSQSCTHFIVRFGPFVGKNCSANSGPVQSQPRLTLY